MKIAVLALLLGVAYAGGSADGNKMDSEDSQDSIEVNQEGGRLGIEMSKSKNFNKKYCVDFEEAYFLDADGETKSSEFEFGDCDWGYITTPADGETPQSTVATTNCDNGDDVTTGDTGTFVVTVTKAVYLDVIGVEYTFEATALSAACPAGGSFVYCVDMEDCSDKASSDDDEDSQGEDEDADDEQTRRLSDDDGQGEDDDSDSADEADGVSSDDSKDVDVSAAMLSANPENFPTTYTCDDGAAVDLAITLTFDEGEICFQFPCEAWASGDVPTFCPLKQDPFVGIDESKLSAASSLYSVFAIVTGFVAVLFY